MNNTLTLDLLQNWALENMVNRSYQLVGVSPLDDCVYICALGTFSENTGNFAIWKGSRFCAKSWRIFSQKNLIEPSELKNVDHCDFSAALNLEGDQIGVTSFHQSDSGQRLTYFHLFDLRSGDSQRFPIDFHFYDLTHTTVGWLGCHFERRRRMFRRIVPDKAPKTYELLGLSAEIYAISRDKIYFFPSTFFSLRSISGKSLCMVDFSGPELKWHEFKHGTGFEPMNFMFQGSNIRKLAVYNDTVFYLEESMQKMSRGRCNLFQITLIDSLGQFDRRYIGTLSLNSSSYLRQDWLSEDTLIRLSEQGNKLCLTTVVHGIPPTLKQLSTVAVQKLFSKEVKFQNNQLSYFAGGISVEEFKRKFGVYKGNIFS